MTPKTTALFAFGEGVPYASSDLEKVGDVFERVRQQAQAMKQASLNQQNQSPQIKMQLIK
jgi:hypothetical protein